MRQVGATLGDAYNRLAAASSGDFLAGFVDDYVITQPDWVGNFDAMGEGLEQEDDGLYRWRVNGGMPMPIQFGLVARRL